MNAWRSVLQSVTEALQKPCQQMSLLPAECFGNKTKNLAFKRLTKCIQIISAKAFVNQMNPWSCLLLSESIKIGIVYLWGIFRHLFGIKKLAHIIIGLITKFLQGSHNCLD